MDAQEIKAAVLVYGIEILLAIEPDELPANISPYRLCGYFTYRGDGSQPVCTTPDKKSAFLMGLALPAFVEHVAKVTAERIAHPDVAVLEAMASLPDPRGRT